MKRLIENSIIIRGIGYPRTKTIFTIQREEEKNNIRYSPLTQFIGRNLTAQFKYNEFLKDVKDGQISFTSEENATVNGEAIDKEKSVEKIGRVKIVIPDNTYDDEKGIQKFIISVIERFLNQVDVIK